jgi:hypothetical protein
MERVMAKGWSHVDASSRFFTLSFVYVLGFRVLASCGKLFTSSNVRSVVASEVRMRAVGRLAVDAAIGVVALVVVAGVVALVVVAGVVVTVVVTGVVAVVGGGEGGGSRVVVVSEDDGILSITSEDL